MNTISLQAERMVRALTPVVREMLLAEVERHAAEKIAARPSRADAEIDEACRAVARAADRHAAVKFTAAEIPARKALERAAAHLGRVMRRHGRMPEGA